MADKIQTEVVVVGSGPGGATVARDLTLAGKKVLMLEWGADTPPTGTTFRGLRNYLGGWFILGKGLLISKEMLTPIDFLSKKARFIMASAK